MPREMSRLLLAAVFTTAFTALLATGCSSAVPGEPAPVPGGTASPTTQAPDPPSDPAVPSPVPAGGCRVSVSGRSISSFGASSSTTTINGRTSFSCDGGSPLGIAAIDGTGVTFDAGGTTVTVAPGTTARVAGYVIAVTSAGDGSAEFRVVPQ